MKPLVSILIPAFNAENWISDTLHSAIEQTWENKEIIVVDDGSKDSTLDIARQFESDVVRVFTHENQGAAATRNKAFTLSRGDYIQWLDADDLLSKDKISRQMEVLQQCADRRTLVSAAWGQFMYRRERTKFEPSDLWCDLDRTEWLLRKMSQNLHMQTATWLASRELTEAAGPWNPDLSVDDDGEYFCRVLLASNGVRFVPGAKVYYRATPNSLSYIGMSDKKVAAQWHSMKLHIQYLRSLEDSNRVHRACVQYLQSWSLHFYPERMDIFREAEQLATQLGGELRVPTFSWKYSWINRCFGPSLANRARVFLPSLKWGVVRAWDRALYRINA